MIRIFFFSSIVPKYDGFIQNCTQFVHEIVTGQSYFVLVCHDQEKQVMAKSDLPVTSKWVLVQSLLE